MSKLVKNVLSPEREKLINLIKRLAKREKAKQGDSVQLSVLLDLAAQTLQYNNWSLFHRDLAKMTQENFAALEAKVHAFPEAQDFIAVQAIDKIAAQTEIEAYVKSNYTPLVEFAYYDNESETGFAWPDVDLFYELEVEFGDRYPIELLRAVASDLEVNHGPWGVEDYGSDVEPEDRV